MKIVEHLPSVLGLNIHCSASYVNPQLMFFTETQAILLTVMK